MIDTNTNKILWVAMAVGIIAILGLSATAIFPDAMSTGENAVTQLTSKYMAITPDDDTQDNFTYGNYNETKLTAYVTGWNGETDTDGTLSFPSTVIHNHKTYNVIGVYGPMPGNDKIKKVVLPDTYTNLSTAMGFMSLAPNLESINVPRNIEPYKFGYMTTEANNQYPMKDTNGNILINNKVARGFIGQAFSMIGGFANKSNLNNISVPNTWTHDDIISFVGTLGSQLPGLSGSTIEIYQNGTYKGTAHPSNNGNSTGWFIDTDHKVFDLTNGSSFYEIRDTTGKITKTYAWYQKTASYTNIYDVKTGHMKLTMNDWNLKKTWYTNFNRVS